MRQNSEPKKEVLMKVGDLVRHKPSKTLGLITYVFFSKNLKGLVEVRWLDGLAGDIECRHIEVVSESR